MEIRVLRENIEGCRSGGLPESQLTRSVSFPITAEFSHTFTCGLAWTVFDVHGNAQDRRLQHRQGTWRRKGLVWDLVLDGDEYGVVTLDGAVEEDD